MNYLCRVPIRLDAPAPEQDVIVRTISRLPGFVRFDPTRVTGRDFELAFEVEGTTLEDAAAAAEELLLSYEDDLERFEPRRLEPLALQAREPAAAA